MAGAGITRREAITALAAGFALGACSPRAGGEPTLDRLRRTGRVRVGFANEAPYAFLDTASGTLTGEAPAVLRHTLEHVGVHEIEGVLTEFGGLIPGLRAGRFDLIAAGMYITPARCGQVLFSNPTYGVGEAFAVHAGNPLGLHSYPDVARHATARLGVVAGAVEQGYAEALGVPSARLVVFPDAPGAIAGLLARRIDAYGGTALTVRDLLRKADNPALEQADPFEDPVIDGKVQRGYGAFAFRPEDTALAAAVNEALAGFLGTPAHAAAVAPFGFSAAELPGAVTAEDLCAA
jgi:polar amino acid transport system substrate-binding protein